MFNKIKLLKDKGYKPTCILDIGAHHGNWTNAMKKIYPDSKYYLFEGINYDELDRFKNDPKVSVYKNILLNDKIEDVDFLTRRNIASVKRSINFPVSRVVVNFKSAPTVTSFGSFFCIGCLCFLIRYRRLRSGVSMRFVNFRLMAKNRTS